MKKILVTGLCTLHWGRLQYGNVGNYYIVEPLFRQLHTYFPDYEIDTTFQMDDGFIQKEGVHVLSMELYYGWRGLEDIQNAQDEVDRVERYLHGENIEFTAYMQEVMECEYIIDVSGDMWGDNAEHVGHERFLVDCLKMKVAELLGKKTILFAVTPGPFSENIQLAKEVFEGLSLVVIRERNSFHNLQKWNFAIDNVVYAPCPSFLFQANQNFESKWLKQIDLHKQRNQVVGMTFGGFNMPKGPYDMWPREEDQYSVFTKVVSYLIDKLCCDIVLFSHTNGFHLPPRFQLINGRDFMILERFYEILINQNSKYKEHIILVNEPLLPCDLKQMIGQMDMLVTGRVHASVAATSLCVPTVFVEYDRRVIYSDKMYGFSEQLGLEEYVTEPGNTEAFMETIQKCFEQQKFIRKHLEITIPEVQNKAVRIFEEISML